MGRIAHDSGVAVSGLISAVSGLALSTRCAGAGCSSCLGCAAAGIGVITVVIATNMARVLTG